jgi:phage gp36-like protein
MGAAVAYCTKEDLVNTLPESQLIELTDDNDTGSVDTEKINEAIRKADDFIDGHIRGRYSLPLSTVPALIRDISIKMSVYYLFRRSLLLTLPESIKDDYKYCLDMLMKIQSGKVNPFESGSEPAFFGTNKATSDNQMNEITDDWGAYLV